MSVIRFGVCVATVLVLGAMAGAQSANPVPALTYSSLSVPGSTNTIAMGINNLGWIVGQYDDSLGGHGFLYRNGIYRAFNVPGALDTEPSGINDTGQIVGAYEGTDSLTHGFLRTAAGYTTIDYPGALVTVPFKITTTGQIVGSFQYDDGTGDYHGFSYDDGLFTLIDFPDSTSTEVYGINKHGQIVGSYAPAGASDIVGFVDNANVFSAINVPGTADPNLTGINSQGMVVGFGQFPKTEGFFFLQGSFVRVLYPLSESTLLFAVNDEGQMVGTYTRDQQNGLLVTFAMSDPIHK
jgi:uncharacterized membrane protein